jgi:hypothetical protein
MTREIVYFLLLTLRIGLAAWFGLSVAVWAMGLAIDMAMRGSSFFGSLTALVLTTFFFPPIALGWGLFCAWRQRRALAGMHGAPGLLSVGSERSIHLALNCEQALRIAESAIDSVLVRSLATRNDTGLAARVSTVADTAALFPGLHEDALSLIATPEGESRCMLRIDLDPVHVWLYGFLSVDLGRCASRMSALETAIRQRVAAQAAVLDQQRHQESARAQASEMRLSILRAQVEPHFIFNTLAHVRASLGPGSEDAAVMLDALVDFLRRNSSVLNATSSTLGEELDMVESYLKLVGMRLGERLRYSTRCPAPLRGQVVPAACVLVLVENAVKHGIERSPDGGAIAIDCDIHAQSLRIAVRNDGPGFDAAGGRRGGLGNLHDRMRLMYGSGHWIAIESPETGGVEVALQIPLEMEAA